MDKTFVLPHIEQLHSATWNRHEQMEQLPFFKELVAGTLPLQSYIAQLRGLAVIFANMENALSSLPKQLPERLLTLTNRRFLMLCDDLSFFVRRMIPDILPAVRCALDAASQIRQAHPGKLLGYLYVIQGTMRGNQVHLPDIIKCFDLNDQGTTFYRGYGANTDTVWQEFCSIFNSVEPAMIPSALVGAAEMYDFMERFHQLLYPLPIVENAFTAAGLNPEAGNHPVPQQPEVLLAALRAGTRCRDEFSYYERCYRERGRRFTDSDVAWLAAVVYMDEDVILEQVLWLGRVLSVRGMPQMLLERQLELLYKELDSLDTHPPLESLQSAIKKLKQRRQVLTNQEQYKSACRDVTKMLHHVPFPDLPAILVAAHLDMKNGIPECKSSLVSWLVEKSILTQMELDAVFTQLNQL